MLFSCLGSHMAAKGGNNLSLHPSLTGKTILDVSCNKLKELSNRQDNKVRMGVPGEDVCLHHQVELVLPQGRRVEEETSGVLPALGPTHLCMQKM